MICKDFSAIPHGGGFSLINLSTVLQFATVLYRGTFHWTFSSFLISINREKYGNKVGNKAKIEYK